MKNNQNPLWRNGQIPASSDNHESAPQNPEEQARRANDRSGKQKRSK